MSGGQGEDMFRSMMDQHIAEQTPQQWKGPHSLGDVIVKQLSQGATASVTVSHDPVTP